MLIHDELVLHLLDIFLKSPYLIFVVLDDALVSLVGLINLRLVLALDAHEELIEVGLLLVFFVVASTLEVHESHLKLFECVDKILFGLLFLLFQELPLAFPKRLVALVSCHNFVLLLL